MTNTATPSVEPKLNYILDEDSVQPYKGNPFNWIEKEVGTAEEDV